MKDENEVLENKSNDVNLNEAKARKWTEIQAKFQTRFPFKNRTDEQLKDRYRRLKMTAQKEITAKKRYSKGTGGGPPTEVGSVTETIYSICLTLDYEMKNLYDSDAQSEVIPQLRSSQDDSLLVEKEIQALHSNVNQPFKSCANSSFDSKFKIESANSKRSSKEPTHARMNKSLKFGSTPSRQLERMSAVVDSEHEIKMRIYG